MPQILKISLDQNDINFVLGEIVADFVAIEEISVRARTDKCPN
jgi:hypothetical protein